MTNLKVGTKVLFRNGENCTVKQIRTNKNAYQTCNTQFKTIQIEKGQVETIVLEFDDGEITIASRDEFEII